MEIDFWKCVSLVCAISGMILWAVGNTQSAIVSVLLGIYFMEGSRD